VKSPKIPFPEPLEQKLASGRWRNLDVVIAEHQRERSVALDHETPQRGPYGRRVVENQGELRARRFRVTGERRERLLCQKVDDVARDDEPYVERGTPSRQMIDEVGEHRLRARRSDPKAGASVGRRRSAEMKVGNDIRGRSHLERWVCVYYAACATSRRAGDRLKTGSSLARLCNESHVLSHARAGHFFAKLSQNILAEANIRVWRDRGHFASGSN
jgi:hypothetical protein